MVGVYMDDDQGANALERKFDELMVGPRSKRGRIGARPQSMSTLLRGVICS